MPIHGVGGTPPVPQNFGKDPNQSLKDLINKILKEIKDGTIDPADILQLEYMLNHTALPKNLANLVNHILQDIKGGLNDPASILQLQVDLNQLLSGL